METNCPTHESESGCKNEDQSIFAAPNNTCIKTQRKFTKTLKVFAILADGRTLNKFEAERLGDHSLRSTISTIKNKYGILILSKKEKVQLRFHIANVYRYYIPPKKLAHARNRVVDELAQRGIEKNICAVAKLIRKLSDQG